MPYQLELSKIAFHAASLVLFVMLAVCSYTDWKYRRIYNKVTLPSLVLGLGLAAITNFPAGLQNAALACAVGFGLFFVLFIFGMMGGGDVKLVAAIGALTGFPLLWDALFLGILAGGLYALAVSVRHGQLGKILKNVFWFLWGLVLWRKMVQPDSAAAVKIPYGLCLAAGTAVAFVLHHFYGFTGSIIALGH